MNKEKMHNPGYGGGKSQRRECKLNCVKLQ